MPFPFTRLPLELAAEVIALASSGDPSSNIQTRNEIYGTACSLSLVSTGVRHLAMPHLLRTVILPTQDTIDLFLRTLEDQRSLPPSLSRLKLDYTKLVRRFWSSQCWEPFVEQPQSRYKDYRPFYDIFANAQELGFDFRSVHLLYEVLKGVPSEPLPNWKCRRVTFAGDIPRWNSLILTSFGLAFFRELTHLTIWAPVGNPIQLFPDGGVPSWIHTVPFDQMPKLRAISFSLVHHEGLVSMPLLTYTLPPPPDTPEEGPVIFSTWATSDEPISHGSLRHITFDPSFSGHTPPTSWEKAFYRGQNDFDV